MTIEVKNCHECPFYEDGEHMDYCKGDGHIIMSDVFIAVSFNCPLKTEPITVEIKEDERISEGL